MKPSSFVVILTFVILMIIGLAVSPLLDIGVEPVPRQGKSITVRYNWPHVSAKVIEQNLTSPVEGMLASLKGVEEVSSNSYFGSCEIIVRLKEQANVSAVRFELTSLLRQSYDRLPKEISYPVVTGGERVDVEHSHHDQNLLLTYQVNADMDAKKMKTIVQQQIKRSLESIEGIGKVEVTGCTDTYLDVKYNPQLLSAYGISAEELKQAIQNFIGQDEIIGTVNYQEKNNAGAKITLHLVMPTLEKPLEEMPLKTKAGNVVYLNDLATLQMKYKVPESYYRVNGLNTVYLNIYIPSDGKVVDMSDAVQEKMKVTTSSISNKMYFHLSYDSAKVQREEFAKLIWRTFVSLIMLLLFVWLCHRDVKYLLMIAFTLLANILIAILAFWVFGIKLHVYSLAGIIVSMGLIIDSTIVMVDHYGYYHNRKAFLSILAAMLTTIGAMAIIFFLPKELQQDLYDFAWIIIIHLVVSLLVALFFVPAMIDRWHYSSHHRKMRNGRYIVRWNHFYEKYILFTARHKWVCYTLLVLAFGMPFYALPDKLGQKDDEYLMEDVAEEELSWYDRLYNQTVGSKFFQDNCRKYLSTYLGGTIHLFADYLHEKAQQPEQNEETVLHICAQMPLGGTAVQLNQKMMMVEDILKSYKEIKGFVTDIKGGRGEIKVKFKKEFANTLFPYQLQNDIISKVITIGGADWSTYGISERGFSNALSLQYRSRRILISGYNYEQLSRLAEGMFDYMAKNNRIVDLAIETPGHENQENEFYMKYNQERMALYQVNPWGIHSKLEEFLKPTYVGYYKNRALTSEVYMTPKTLSFFDFWHLENEQLAVDSTDVFVPELLKVERREAKNVIPKKNQEYVLNVAFNVLGSYAYSKDYIDEVVKHFNKVLPVGYHCKNFYEMRHPESDGNNYWLLFLVAVIVFFICSIHFESMRYAWVIISVIPVSMIGAMLTFYCTQVDFGSGGFASMVLLIGIVVNSSIYILSQYHYVSGLAKERKKQGIKGNVKNYICAYNHKVIPVFLTVLSTIIGLLPFLLEQEEEKFWFSFAMGVTGGLLFSVIALVFVMPIFINFKKSTL